MVQYEKYHFKFKKQISNFRFMKKSMSFTVSAFIFTAYTAKKVTLK